MGPFMQMRPGAIPWGVTQIVGAVVVCVMVFVAILVLMMVVETLAERLKRDARVRRDDDPSVVVRGHVAHPRRGL